MNAHEVSTTVSDGVLPSGDDVVADTPSLTDDIVALIDDGKTLFDAEVQFQTTRASFAFGKARVGAAYGIAAFALLHLALVALVVGAVIALTPAVGAWLATLIVVGLLILAGLALAVAARGRFRRAASAFGERSR